MRSGKVFRMGMSHDNCSHPRTPAGRAACRKAGGPGTPVDTGSNTDVRCRKCRGTGATTATIQHRVNCTDYTKGKVQPIPRIVPQPPSTSKGCTCIEGALGRRHASDCPRSVRVPRPARTRTLRWPHDLADVPAVFSSVIRHAWEQGYEVRTGDPFNENERNIVISSEHGWLTMAWRTTTPHGIHGSWWRPRGTSVSTKLMTVNVGIDRLNGDVD